MHQGAKRAGSIDARLQAVEFAEVTRLFQIACSRIAVHLFDLDDIHYIQSVMHACHSDSIE